MQSWALLGLATSESSSPHEKANVRVSRLVPGLVWIGGVTGRYWSRVAGGLEITPEFFLAATYASTKAFFIDILDLSFTEL